MIQKIKNLFFHLPKSIFYNYYYKFHSKKLTLIGITGTDGKTTSSILVYETLKNAGIKAGVITTIGAKFGDVEIDTGLHMTSPDPSLIHKIFRQMINAGVTHVVCEVTAHALDQYRFYGFRFKVGAITNISHEHLEYFHTMDNYVSAKSKIFKQSDFAILNHDDKYFDYLKNDIKTKYLSYGINKKSDIQATNIKISKTLLNFSVDQLNFSTDSNYQYQIYNILLTLSIINQLQIDPQVLIETVKKFPITKGRREEINNDFGFKTIVDFAHTPNALHNTLSSLKQKNKGRLIVIFGATGGRDKAKRPMMGKVVSEIANIAIITADDTRNEKVEDINHQIISGIESKHIHINHSLSLPHIKSKLKNSKNFVYFNIFNRQDAFNMAIKIAKPGDVVIACGKGHEKTILHGKIEYPWSETEAFRTAFRNRTQK
jgi:UDP-N-acetylmuramoyl-L-alanyl-D-glutamate--2,6-diaminopimelate ligase